MISKIISEDLVRKVQKALNSAEKVVIVPHVGPDGDAMGSCLGMWHYLMTLGKEPVVVLPTRHPEFYNWMPGVDSVMVHEEEPEQVEQLVSETDLIFAQDFNVIHRLGKMAECVANSKAYKVLIDHHLHPGDFADTTISYPEISSTSELVFRLICRLGDFSKINLAGAECIYTGMMTDTGGFTYNSNKHEIYTIIGELIKLGVDKDAIYRRVFNTYSEDRLRLMGYCLYNKMKIYPEYRAALITLTQEEMNQFNFRNGDAEGFVNIPLSIHNVDFSVFLREDPEKIKVSLRSQGSFPANKFSAEVFNGGGHLNAAGGESYSTMEEAIRKFEEALPEFKAFLEN